MPDSQVLANVVGTNAGLCSIASFVPQIIKILKERDASGVSLRMFAVTVTAFTLWCTYGVLLKSWPITASNGACLTLSVIILALRWRFGGKLRNRASRQDMRAS